MIRIKRFKHVGIVGYGTYVPRYRLPVVEVARVWGKEGRLLEESLGLRAKAVADSDEDAVTMAVAAAKQAVSMVGVKPENIGALMMGSESHPYAVKPSGTIVADVLGMGSDYFCVDLEFACKAGTAGMQIVAAMIECGMIDYGLAIGSDTAQGRPGDALEYTAGAGAAAFLLGKRSSEWLAKIESTSSFTSDTPDFWRRSGEEYPAHGGRFTGDPGYFAHVVEGTRRFMKKTGENISDFDRVVFHMPNLKFPLKVAEILGIRKEQLADGLIVKEMGNPYSASALLGLAAVLDRARKGMKILVTAYGSGAGSDTLTMNVKGGLATARRGREKLGDYLQHYTDIDYGQYLQLTGGL